MAAVWRHYPKPWLPASHSPPDFDPAANVARSRPLITATDRRQRCNASKGGRRRALPLQRSTISDNVPSKSRNTAGRRPVSSLSIGCRPGRASNRRCRPPLLPTVTAARSGTTASAPLDSRFSASPRADGNHQRESAVPAGAQTGLAAVDDHTATGVCSQPLRRPDQAGGLGSASPSRRYGAVDKDGKHFCQAGGIQRVPVNMVEAGGHAITGNLQPTRTRQSTCTLGDNWCSTVEGNVWRSRFCSPYTVSSVRSVGGARRQPDSAGGQEVGYTTGLPAKKRR